MTVEEQESSQNAIYLFIFCVMVVCAIIKDTCFPNKNKNDSFKNDMQELKNDWIKIKNDFQEVKKCFYKN